MHPRLRFVSECDRQKQLQQAVPNGRTGAPPKRQAASSHLYSLLLLFFLTSAPAAVSPSVGRGGVEWAMVVVGGGVRSTTCSPRRRCPAWMLPAGRADGFAAAAAQVSRLRYTVGHERGSGKGARRRPQACGLERGKLACISSPPPPLPQKRAPSPDERCSIRCLPPGEDGVAARKIRPPHPSNPPFTCSQAQSRIRRGMCLQRPSQQQPALKSVHAAATYFVVATCRYTVCALFDADQLLARTSENLRDTQSRLGNKRVDCWASWCLDIGTIVKSAKPHNTR